MLKFRTPHRQLWVVALLALMAACGQDPQTTGPGDAAVAPPSPGPPIGEHIWETPDGNRIPYSVAGKIEADVTIVLVHCWMCNQSFWDLQLPALGSDYRTVTFDLPGHGEATSERTQWTVSGYGEDVAGLIGNLGLTNVVLVGHSMGGPVSLRAAALLPGKVRGIVAVDTLHDADFKFEGEQIEAFMQAFETDFTGTCESFVNQMFVEENVQPVIDQVRQAGCDATRSAVGTALMRDFGAIDMPTWFRQAGVPIRAINAAAPNPTKIEVNRKYSDFDVVLVDGVGHYLHMTRPDTFNQLLLEAISEILDREHRSDFAQNGLTI
jgi:pimeloyl-ACP methyl ester carboxylesterase